jgi:hypothetical protein
LKQNSNTNLLNSLHLQIHKRLMLERFSHSDIWLNYILIGLFIAIVALKQINSYRFNKLISLGWTNQYIKLIMKSPKNDIYFSSVLIFTSTLSFTLALLLYNANWLYQINELSFELVLKPFLYIIGYLLLKFAAQKLIGFIFHIDKVITPYLILKYNLLFYIGIVIYIPLLLVYYSNMSEVYFNVIILLLFVFYVAKIVLFLVKSRSPISSHLFYFILYICSFEIMPIFYTIWYLK